MLGGDLFRTKMVPSRGVGVLKRCFLVFLEPQGARTSYFSVFLVPRGALGALCSPRGAQRAILEHFRVHFGCRFGLIFHSFFDLIFDIVFYLPGELF